MKAFVGGELKQWANPSSHPGRRLVRVDVSARKVSPPTQKSPFHFLKLLKSRANIIWITLRHDGLGDVIARGIHMFRRDSLGRDNRCASVCGHIRDEGVNEEGREESRRVSAFSISHPPHTELATVRPEHVFEIRPGIDGELASLVLYGGIAVHAARQAKSSGLRVGLYGDDVLAQITASLLVAFDVPFELHPECTSGAVRQTIEQLAAGSRFGESSTAGIAEPELWLTTSAIGPGSVVGADRVLGIGVGLPSLRAAWPQSASHEAFSPDELAGSPDRNVDLYYDDGPCDWPEWMAAPLFEEYLRLVTEGKVAAAGGAEAGTTALPELKRDKGWTFVHFPRTAPVAKPAGPLRLRIDKPDPAKKRISLVGAGRWPLAMSIRQIMKHPGIELRMVCDRRPEVAYLASQSFPFTHMTTNYGDVLDDPETDLIVVAPYHGAHADLAQQALEAGKHCFVEKPPVVNKEQYDKLFEAATKAQTMLHVGYNRRFAPAAHRMLKLLGEESGPTTINITVRSVDIPPSSWYYWASNGSRVISNICHFTDFSMMLTDNAEPVEVSANSSLVGRADQNATVSIKFADGSLASILYTDKGQSLDGYDQRYQVMRGNTTGLIENFTRMRVLRRGRAVDSWRGIEDMGHREQMAAVAEALTTDGRPPVPLEVAQASAKIYLAAAKSIEMARPVRIDEV